MAEATIETEPPPIAEPPRKQPPARERELEIYRSLLETPKEFRNGFTWTSVVGAFFCGLLMMPGSIYLSLITGGSISAAWVTLIIFSEVSRRALKTLNTQELVVLLYVAGAMSLGGPIAALIFRQYFITSDPVRDAGLLGQFPTWWAPQPESPAILNRDLLHSDWLIPIAFIVFATVIGRVGSYTLGYFFFRLTSDVEKLPFPMAPVAAQGSMALAESAERKVTWKWRVFSTGAIIGLVFAAIQIGVPLITGALLAKPVQLIPLPWYDSTTLTQSLLPATPTGVTIDVGLILIGMVVPFWAVMGSGAAVILTCALSPILYRMGVLTRWQPGMDTVSTTFVNSIDFWMSFGLGVALGVSCISVYQTARDVMRKLKEIRRQKAAGATDTARHERIWDTPAGRGDFSPWIALGIYVLSSSAIIAVCHAVVPRFPLIFLAFFTLFYTPFISYVNAKIIGICGNYVEIPFVREGAYILSGYRGVEIWLAPVPVENYGVQTQNFRVTELTGTRFWSYVKADCLVVPLSLLLSFIFWAFIWHAGDIPSERFPWAQKMWDLQARQTVLLYSATLDGGGGQPLFFEALHPRVIGGAFATTMGAFAIMSALEIPIMAIFGFIQAVGNMPHMFIMQIIGALLGRYYLQKKFGQQKFLQMAPVLVAGYGTGVGLIALIGVAVNLIMKAISMTPF